jgi:hemin uptake protein HemP
MTSTEKLEPKPTPTDQTLACTKKLRLSSQEIMQGHHEIEIEHIGMLYRLRCTALGKLILTK